ncbi:hypothetical protein ACWV95_19880 [Streptomyces albus]
MDPKQAAAFEVFLAWQRPIGDGIAWIADDWKEQHPFRILEFLKGPSPEEAALAYGADPQDITDGLQLHEIWERDEEEHTDDFFDVIAFGEADGWTWLGYHEHNSASLRAPLDPPPSERITLTATMAKGIYDFSYEKDGVYQNPFPAEYGEQPRRDMYEIPGTPRASPPSTRKHPCPSSTRTSAARRSRPTGRAASPSSSPPWNEPSPSTSPAKPSPQATSAAPGCATDERNTIPALNRPRPHHRRTRPPAPSHRCPRRSCAPEGVSRRHPASIPP